MSLRRTIPDLESKYRGPAYRAIVTVLREYGPLANAVRSWRVMEGQPGEIALPTSLDQFPLLSVTPLSRQSMVMAVDASKVNFGVSVEVFVAGTCFEDLASLWEAVEDAVVRERPFRDTTVMRFLGGCVDPAAPAGVINLHPEGSGLLDVKIRERDPKANTILHLRGQGSLVCFIRRPA